MSSRIVVKATQKCNGNALTQVVAGQGVSQITKGKTRKTLGKAAAQPNIRNIIGRCGGVSGELVLKPTAGVSQGSQVDFTLLLAWDQLWFIPDRCACQGSC